MWLLVVFFSLTQDKLLLILKYEYDFEGLVKIYTPPPNEIPGYDPGWDRPFLWLSMYWLNTLC